MMSEKNSIIVDSNVDTTANDYEGLVTRNWLWLTRTTYRELDTPKLPLDLNRHIVQHKFRDKEIARARERKVVEE
jgi:hypothetical protein